jgi:hypothetical protein
VGAAFFTDRIALAGAAAGGVEGFEPPLPALPVIRLRMRSASSSLMELL